MSDDGESDLIVKVFPWKLFIGAWIQKQLSTLTSAKTWITAIILFLSYQLTVTKHTYQVLAGEKVIDINTPYLSGTDWSNMVQGILIAYLGARILQPTIRTVGEKWAQVVKEKNNGHNGNGKETSVLPDRIKVDE